MDENERLLVVLEEKVKGHDEELKTHNQRLTNIETTLQNNEVRRVKDNADIQHKLDNIGSTMLSFMEKTDMNFNEIKSDYNVKLDEINQQLKERETLEQKRLEEKKKDWHSVGLDILKKILYTLIVFVATLMGIKIF